MRINFALSSLKFGGGMKILISLADRLGQRGHVVSITTPDHRSQLDWAQIENVNIIQVSIKNNLIYRLARKLHAYLSGTRQPIEMMYWDEVSAFMRALPESDITIATSPLTALATALNNSSSAAFNYLQHFEPLIFTEPLMSRFATLSPRLPLRVIANSTWLKNKLIDQLQVGEENIIVQPSAVDTDVFFPRPVGRFPRTKGRCRVVTMGKPHPWKGFNDALDAMKLVFAECADVEWFVYAEKDVFKKDEAAPYTLLTGIANESLAELLSSADIVIVPSWYESSPLPVLEALACGAALVTTSLGTEDLVTDHSNALVVPPKRPDLMAQAVISLINDEVLRKRLIQAGLVSVQSFSWESTVSAIEQLFADSLKKGV